MFIRAILTVLVMLGVLSQAHAQEYRRLAMALLEASRSLDIPTPVNPSPKPAPVSDECDNCNGVGKVGDGTIMLTCPVCNGSGKKVSGQAPVSAFPHYPLRSSYWSGCPNWTHLTVGPHRGKFDSEWLKGLSNPELQSLHADDHEGRVKWDFVVRGEGSAAKAPAMQNCPPGGCPPSGRRKGLFQQLLNP